LESSTLHDNARDDTRLVYCSSWLSFDSMKLIIALMMRKSSLQPTFSLPLHAHGFVLCDFGWHWQGITERNTHEWWVLSYLVGKASIFIN